jgi:hypothetical protein
MAIPVRLTPRMMKAGPGRGERHQDGDGQRQGTGVLVAV